MDFSQDIPCTIGTAYGIEKPSILDNHRTGNAFQPGIRRVRNQVKWAAGKYSNGDKKQDDTF